MAIDCIMQIFKHVQKRELFNEPQVSIFLLQHYNYQHLENLISPLLTMATSTHASTPNYFKAKFWLF